MTVGILLICHNHIGEQLLETATDMMEVAPIPTTNLSVLQDDDPIELLNRARKKVAEIDQGDGVLVLTDMYGSTPSNIAHRLKEKNHVNVLSGVNLPMVVRAMNYPQLNLAEMTARVAAGGRDGIIEGDLV